MLENIVFDQAKRELDEMDELSYAVKKIEEALQDGWFPRNDCDTYFVGTRGYTVSNERGEPLPDTVWRALQAGRSRAVEVNGSVYHITF